MKSTVGQLIDIQVDLANTLYIESGMLQAGYLTWSLYGVSAHQAVEVTQKKPLFQIRETGETNYAGFIKLPVLKAGNEFQFKTTLLFSNHNLKFPILNFKFDKYPNTFIMQYCKGAKFWETRDPDLIDIAQTLRGESGDDVLKYLRIAFQFVHENMKFRENLDHRLGARRALKEGKGDCDEFSDLFITLCRINRIPARRVLGMILTDKNSSNLHAWAEVYIPIYEQWVPFDVALNEFASIKWNYMIRAHVGIRNEAPLVWLKSNYPAVFRDS